VQALGLHTVCAALLGPPDVAGVEQEVGGLAAYAAQLMRVTEVCCTGACVLLPSAGMGSRQLLLLFWRK
jgi:hypothetical protein